MASVAITDNLCFGNRAGGITYVGGGEMISFTIYGNPVAQGRPRAFIPKSKTKVWTRPIVTDPSNAREWKQLVKAQAALYRRNETGLIQGSIHLSLEFYLMRPKSLPKKVTEHIKRPDLENLSKAVIDALQGIFFRDDSQISLLLLSKTYCRDEVDPPRVVVAMDSLDEM